jgi:hypothetical protein
LFPSELAHCRYPKNKATAEAGAFALIEFLKKTDEPLRATVDRITVGAWLEKFTHNDPFAALPVARFLPYVWRIRTGGLMRMLFAPP